MAESTLTITDHHIITVEGDLTFETVMMLWKKSQSLFHKIQAKIIIDLAKITHCNSAGLSLLIEWQKLALKQNKTIQFKNIPDQLLDIAKVSGITDILESGVN